MREIPVSSLGTDKVRVEARDDGSYFVVYWPGAEASLAEVEADCPTEALLAIVADRTSDEEKDALVQRIEDALRLSFAPDGRPCLTARAWEDITAIVFGAQPDADQIGEGR